MFKRICYSLTYNLPIFLKRLFGLLVNQKAKTRPADTMEVEGQFLTSIKESKETIDILDKAYMVSRYSQDKVRP